MSNSSFKVRFTGCSSIKGAPVQKKQTLIRKELRPPMFNLEERDEAVLFAP